MSGDDTTVRLVSASNIDGKKESVKQVKPEKDKNFVIWHAGINTQDERKLATQYLLKNIKDSGYSLMARNNDGYLSEQQQEFLLKNQLKKVEIKDKDGKETTAFEKQGKTADKKLTKGEIDDIFSLENSLSKIDEEKLTPEEKDFKKGFENTFTKKEKRGEIANSESLNFESDMKKSGATNVYAFYKQYSDYLPDRKLSEEKNIWIDTDQNGKADTLMSEKEVHDFCKEDGDHIQRIGTIRTTDSYTEKQENKYNNIDEYMKKMPKNVNKSIEMNDDKEVKKTQMPENASDVDSSLYEKLVNNYFNPEIMDESVKQQQQKPKKK